MDRRFRWVTLALSLAVLARVFGQQAAVQAFGPYPAGSTGTFLSFPQCGGSFPASAGAFGIIGVTGGRAFYQNPCLVGEYAWAQQAPAAPSAVMNLNVPIGTTAFKAQSGPRGACAGSDAVCLGFNYGYNAAQAAVADAASQQTTAVVWWLDIETENSWAADSSQNVPVIEGAVAALQTHGLLVGLYSTPSQWQQISGNFQPRLPVWLAGAADAASAAGACQRGHGFGGGSVWLVQFATAGADGVYACPAQVIMPPATPTDVRASALDTTHLRLDWDEVADTVDSYGVYDSVRQVIAPVGGGVTSTTVGGLEPGTTYCFTLYAANRLGASAWSAYACATTPQAAP
ncbi:MAG: fibronectin type III domain-containing protein [Dehalococcoidia bacterium]